MKLDAANRAQLSEVVPRRFRVFGKGGPCGTCVDFEEPTVYGLLQECTSPLVEVVVDGQCRHEFQPANSVTRSFNVSREIV